ncbi:MAG TPA: hemolysin family protein [Armatimonadota bacterium]|nr:hemolysin family protein [Armatimonadota bacterium]HOS43427.1 hemolysin family protein [Armatimonadota bacterium]
MTIFDWLLLGVVVLLIGISGIFAAAEIGILSVNRFRTVQLAESGAPRARLLQRLLQQPAHLLTAILVVITGLNFANAVLVTYWLHLRLGLPAWVPFAGLLLLVLIFAELLPMAYAAANPELVATRLAPVMHLATLVLRPFITAVTAFAHLLIRLLGGIPRTRPLVTEEEVLTIVEMETERGTLEEEEKELIKSIFEFSDTIVREIMVPRIDIVAAADTLRIGAAIAMTVEHKYSRLPVYQGSLDHIIGTVHAKDMLPFLFRDELTVSVRDAMRPVAFVPETKRVSELLREFRETKQTLAIVLDEYGGTAGLVTVEDLLEEIVGEIYDEYDVDEPPPIEWLDARTVCVDGKLPIDDLGDLLGRAMPEGEYDTVGGLLYSRFGDVPTRGEAVEIDGFHFIVERLDGHRITRVRIVLPPDIERRDGEAP